MSFECTLIDFNADETCSVAEGGISHVYVTEYANVTSATLTADVISNFVMASAGTFKKFTPDDDDTAKYDQVGTREGKKHTLAQETFLKWEGVNATHATFVNGLTPCCALVLIVVYNNGTRFVQGLDKVGTATVKSKTAARATVSVLSGTGAESDRTEITISSVGRHASLATTLTDAAIEAL